ncbi:MAG: VOC family protein [Candidatus Nanopelagicales bacterium]
MTTLQITVDCVDAQILTRFWMYALGYELEHPPGGFLDWKSYWLSRGMPEQELEGAELPDSIIDPSGEGPRIWFQQVPEPKVVKNRLHLDLDISGGRDVPLDQRRERIDAEVKRLQEAGAAAQRVLEVDGADYYAVVMQDPEGNEFCLG